jgi:hypothetical protein
MFYPIRQIWVASKGTAKADHIGESIIQHLFCFLDMVTANISTPRKASRSACLKESGVSGASPQSTSAMCK